MYKGQELGAGSIHISNLSANNEILSCISPCTDEGICVKSVRFSHVLLAALHSYIQTYTHHMWRSESLVQGGVRACTCV